MKCLICGKEGSWLCDECKYSVDIESLCFNVIHNIDGIKEKLDCSSLECIKDILKDEKSPKKEEIIIKSYCFTRNKKIVCEYSVRDLIDNYYQEIINDPNLDIKSKQFFKCVKLSRSFYSKNYQEAYDIAEELCYQELSNECLLTLIDFYILIRKYDIAHELINRIDDECVNYYIEECEARESRKKKEYSPATKAGKEKYASFLNSIGFEMDYTPSFRCIKDEDYPKTEFIYDMDFDSFVAYDLETTGFSEKKACITEIGAIKVINGKVIDSAEFKFQELIHPYAGVKRVEKQAEKVTGITTQMVMNARSVREVFNDFADFVEDYPLVGYNNQRFDSIRLRRAGRYANRIITNKQFDLLPIAKKEMCGEHATLTDIATKYNIVNPNAHRAYTDALTTAKLYIALNIKSK